MGRKKIACIYDTSELEVDRPQPLTDSKIEELINNIISKKMKHDITDQIYEDFKIEMCNWLKKSTLNNLVGLDTFNRIDICNGCTQFIDSIYMRTTPQVFLGDYKYHERLNKNIQYSETGKLKENSPLLIAMPFPLSGSPHSQMSKILDECLEKNIDVYIDGAWITCCRDIEFNFSHPAIKEVAISLSKGLGLGWNRIGLRWTKNIEPDSISIMNDFHMNNRVLVIIGLYFLRNLPVDYLWKIHENSYYKICSDFNLTPTNAIHLALKDNSPVGISPLIRYLEKYV